MVSRKDLASAPSSFAVSTLTPFTSMACESKSSPCEAANFDFNCASCFSSDFTFSTICSIRLVTSNGCDFNNSAERFSSDSIFCTYSNATDPATASTRRTPAATPPSATILNSPISPVRATWVPPQNSRDEPISSTRTMSPYFSPNNIVAPDFCASSIGITRASVAWLARISALTIASTFAICAPVIGALWAKSKRVLAASTSEPFCCT